MGWQATPQGGLETVGLRLPLGLPSHDEPDSALAAYVACCLRQRVAECVGVTPYADDYVFRERFISPPGPGALLANYPTFSPTKTH